jgi:hypothetical protein
MWVLVAVVTAVLLAACGGTAPQSSTGDGVGGGGGGGGTPGPAGAPTGGGGGGGGGDGLTDPCGLLTPDEVAGATSSDPVTGSGTPGDPARCIYTLSDGTEVLRLNVFRNGGAAHFQSLVGAGSAENVEGVGDRALYERGSRRLNVMAGDDLVTLTEGPFVSGTDLNGMGSIAAARLRGGSVPPGSQITAPPVIQAETACELLTGDEAATVIGKGPMKAEANPSATQFCTYALVATGEVLLSVYLDAKGGQSAWQMFTGSLVTEPVQGLGEAAVFEPSTGILFALQGDSMLNVNVYGQSPEQALTLDRRLMEIMLGNL